jgi:hypothetical protein
MHEGPNDRHRTQREFSNAGLSICEIEEKTLPLTEIKDEERWAQISSISKNGNISQ